MFDIRSFNVALRGSSPIFFPWKGIWGVNTPQIPCDNFFVWTMARGKILVTILGREDIL